jgi:16S rRNA processing protein RimM
MPPAPSWGSAAYWKSWSETVERGMDQDLVAIGRIVKTHGLKGELRIVPLTAHPDRFRAPNRMILEAPDGTRKTCTLVSVRGEKDRLIVSCGELSSVEEAGAFVQGWVKIPESEVRPLPEGRFYHFDLIGTDVYREDGSRVGRIEEIIETGSNDVLVVRNGEKEHLIPATREAIRSMDVGAKRMVLNPMEGLVDDDEV